MHMDRKSKMKDVHLHFTGSLSPDYAYNLLKLRNPDFINKYSIQSATDLSAALRGMFTNDYKLNQKIFNDVYSLIQSATKPADYKETYNTYKSASYQLSLNLLKFGISDYTIIAGPDIDIDKTYARYLGMINGFEEIEKLYKNTSGKICITFIRNNNSVLKNYSYNTLKDICALLKQEPFKSRCIGFDISGYEYPDEKMFNSNLNILSEILETTKIYGLSASIGLHAGEIITGTQQDCLYDDYFIKLSKLKLDNIGHGTYLWMSPKHQKILKLFADTTRFDICPESNELLTPVKNVYSCFDNLKKCGIKFTLNRDDPLIFNNWQSHQR